MRNFSDRDLSVRNLSMNSDAPVSVDTQTGRPLPRKNIIFRSWRPGDQPQAVAAFLLVFGLLYIALAIAILILNGQIFVARTRYDDLCALNTVCEVPFFTTTTPVAGPSYIYYRIHGFHQNNRRYVASIPFNQLRNGELKTPDDLDGCKYRLYNHELNVTTAVDGTPLDPNAVAYPCGVAASLHFTDSFELVNLDSGDSIPISGKDISWAVSREHQFLNYDLSKQWINVQDERFINWMHIAPFDDFLKTWGRIDQDIPAGRYGVRINNVWDSARFDGKKDVVLSQADFYGTRNYFLGITFLVLGFLACAFGVCLAIRAVRRPRRDLGQ